MNHIPGFVFKLLAAFLLFYALTSLYLYLMQKNAMYFPNSQDFISCPAFNDAEKISHSGTRAYFKKNSENIVVVYHGNAGSACDRAFLKDIFERNGYSYIFVEYAGYSNDDKGPSKEKILKDVENVKDFIEKHNFKKVVLFGESLGSGLASYHQTLSKPDAMVLIEPFDSILDYAKSRYYFFPVKLLLTENFDNRKWLENYNGKITVIHGQNDDIMPKERAQSLFDSINSESKKFIEIENAGHNDIYSHQKTIDAIEKALV